MSEKMPSYVPSPEELKNAGDKMSVEQTIASKDREDYLEGRKSWHRDMPTEEKHAIWKNEASEAVNEIKKQMEAQGIKEGDEVYLNDNPEDIGIFSGIEEYESGFYFKLKKEGAMQNRHPKEIQKVTLSEWKELK